MSDSETRAREKLLIDYNVSRETMGALERYRELLLKWSGQINLVGPSTLEHFWQRHALDCAQLTLVAGSNFKSAADFGSGAGLPGLILAVRIYAGSRESFRCPR
jgi:16S rRNA (guanine527-N7)-methyltransferase